MSGCLQVTCTFRAAPWVGSLCESWGDVGRQKSLGEVLARGPEELGHPFPWGEFPCPNPLWLCPGAQTHSLCTEKDLPWSSHIGKHPKSSLPWGSCTPALHSLVLHYSQVNHWCWEVQQNQLHPASLSLGAVNAENGINYGGRRDGWNEHQKASRAQDSQRTCIKGRLCYQ